MCCNHATARGQSPASHHGALGSNPGQVMWDCVGRVALGQVFSEYFAFPCKPYSTDCYTLICHAGLTSCRRTKWTQSHPTPRNKLIIIECADASVSTAVQSIADIWIV
jgi:hypothetical protein